MNYGEMEIEEDAEIDGNVTNHNSIEVSGGVEIYGTFTNKVGANAFIPNDSGTLDIGGDLKNDPNASIAMEGSLEMEGNFENAGQIETIASGQIISIERTFHNTGEMSLCDARVDVGGVFDNDISGVVMGTGHIQQHSRF